MNERFKTLRFNLVSDDPCAFLVGRSSVGASFTVDMRQTRVGFWFADVDLPYGTYHTRFYSGDKRRVIYSGPAIASGGWEDGLDAVVVVHSGDLTGQSEESGIDRKIRAEFLRYGRQQLEIVGDSQRLMVALGDEINKHNTAPKPPSEKAKA